MKHNVIKYLIIFNTVILFISLGIIYFRYSSLLEVSQSDKIIQSQPLQKTIEQQKNLFEENIVSTITLQKEQISSEEAIPEIKLRKPKFVYFSSKAKKVELIGDFNDWVAQPMKKVSNNRWEIIIEIPEGKYLYNFVVDGKIILDPNNKKPPQLSPHGYKSSVLELK